MGKGWRRSLAVGLFVFASAGIAAFDTGERSESGLWVLTSARLLELDLESGELVRERRVSEEARLLDAGERVAPFLASPERIESLDADAGRAPGLRFAIRELPSGEKILAAAPAAKSRGVVLAFSSGAEVYTESGALETEVEFPFPVEVAAFDSAYLWGLGSRGGFRLERADLGAAPLELDVAWSSAPRSACYDELAERLVVAEEEGIHWLDREGREVATAPLPGVEQLACGRFGRVWASGSEGTVLLHSIGEVGAIEAVIPANDSSAVVRLAADPRDFAAFVAEGGEVSRWTVTGRRAWRVELEPGERVTAMVAGSPPEPTPATRPPRRPEAPRGPAAAIVARPKAGPGVLDLRGRLALNETKPSPAPAGSGQPVDGAQVTAYGADVVSATSATDGTFLTPSFPHVSGDSVVVFARKQTSQGRLMASTTVAPPAGQTHDLGEVWMDFDCALAF